MFVSSLQIQKIEQILEINFLLLQGVNSVLLMLFNDQCSLEIHRVVHCPTQSNKTHKRTGSLRSGSKRSEEPMRPPVDINVSAGENFPSLYQYQ